MHLTFSRCLLIAAIVAVPSLFMGLFMDDYMHLLTIDGKLDLASPYDIYRFAGDPATVDKYIERGPLPWYTWPEIHLHFFRPLTSALMVLDRALFGEQYWLYHAHSILWYVAMVALVGLLYRLFLGPAALVAMALFALDEAHAIPVDWWSNRNSLVGCVPAVAGLLAHIRWREQGWKPGLPLSLVCYAVGFLGVEGAIGIMGYLAAYELFGKRDAIARRIACLVPAAALSFAYLAWYKLSGYGVHGSGIYLDPIGGFPEFIRRVPERMVMLLANQFVLLPIEAPVGEPALTPPIVAMSIAVLLLTGWLLLRVWRAMGDAGDHTHQRAMLWLLAGAIISTAPGLATFPSGRLMLLPSIGTAAAVALVLQWAWQRRMRWLSRGIIVLHVILPLAFWLALPLFLGIADRRGNESIAASNLGEGNLDGVYQIAINPPDPYHALYPAVVGRFKDQPEPIGWNFISMAPCAHRVTRIDEHTIDVEWVDGQMLGTLFEQLVRSPEYPYRVGDVVKRGAFDAEILSLANQGPNKVRFTFRVPLEDPALQFFVWDTNRFIRWTPIAEGESVLLEKTHGLFDPRFILGLSRD